MAGYLLALGCLSIAVAEPWVKIQGNVYTRTLNAVIVLDVSRSMLAEDGIAGMTRLESGITAIEKLLNTYPDGCFGLVFFTDERVSYSPCSDRAALVTLMKNIPGNYQVRGEGSDPVSALLETVVMIKELPFEVNTLFLISDGGKKEENIGPLIEDLKEAEVQLVVVGVGGLVPAPIPVYDEKQVLIGYHHQRGIVAYTALEELFLRALADGANGEYLTLTNENDLIRIAVSQGLDTQPLAQQSTASLIWLPVMLSLVLMAVLYLGKNFRG